MSRFTGETVIQVEGGGAGESAPLEGHLGEHNLESRDQQTSRPESSAAGLQPAVEGNVGGLLGFVGNLKDLTSDSIDLSKAPGAGTASALLGKSADAYKVGALLVVARSGSDALQQGNAELAEKRAIETGSGFVEILLEMVSKTSPHMRAVEAILTLVDVQVRIMRAELEREGIVPRQDTYY